MRNNITINKCPVCGNPSIPDYRNKDVVCPQCGSDLKIYKTLTDASNCGDDSAGSVRRYKILSVALPVVVALILGLLFYHEHGRAKNDLTAQNVCIAELREQITILSEKQQNTVEKSEDYIEYIVVHNDGPWGIVKKVFGDTRNWAEEYQQIAKDNGLWDERKGTWKIIHPGQILRIKKEK